MYFKTCIYCGANLDPSEKCDCEHNKDIKTVGDEVREVGVLNTKKISTVNTVNY